MQDEFCRQPGPGAFCKWDVCCCNLCNYVCEVPLTLQHGVSSRLRPHAAAAADSAHGKSAGWTQPFLGMGGGGN